MWFSSRTSPLTGQQRGKFLTEIIQSLKQCSDLMRRIYRSIMQYSRVNRRHVMCWTQRTIDCIDWLYADGTRDKFFEQCHRQFEFRFIVLVSIVPLYVMHVIRYDPFCLLRFPNRSNQTLLWSLIDLSRSLKQVLYTMQCRSEGPVNELDRAQVVPLLIHKLYQSLSSFRRLFAWMKFILELITLMNSLTLA